MNLNKWTLTITIAMFLTACGGGDNSDDSSNTGNSSSNDGISQLKLNTVVANRCGIESPKSGVQVLFHDAVGNVIEEHKTDLQGELEVDWPSNAMHFSTVAENYTTASFSFKTLSVDTIMDFEGGDFGVINFTDRRDTVGCNCKKVSFPFQTLAEDAPDTWLYLGDAKFNLNPYSYNPPVEWCDGKGAMDIQLISADGQTSLAGSVDLSGIDEYILSLDDFTQVGVMVDTAAISSAHDIFGYSTDGWSNNTFATEPVFVYPTMSEYNYVSSFIGEQIQIGKATAFSKVTSKYKVDSQGKTSQVMLWDVHSGFKSAAYSFVKEFATEKAPYQYDFSNISNEIALTHFILNARYGGGIAEWSLWGGVSGIMPDISLPSELEAIFGSLEEPNLWVGVRSYGDEKSLAEWRMLLAERSRMKDPELSPLNKETNYMSVDFYFEYLGI